MLIKQEVQILDSQRGLCKFLCLSYLFISTFVLFNITFDSYTSTLSNSLPSPQKTKEKICFLYSNFNQSTHLPSNTEAVLGLRFDKYFQPSSSILQIKHASKKHKFQKIIPLFFGTLFKQDKLSYIYSFKLFFSKHNPPKSPSFPKLGQGWQVFSYLSSISHLS
jgi:hypothetical protein